MPSRLGVSHKGLIHHPTDAAKRLAMQELRKLPTLQHFGAGLSKVTVRFETGAKIVAAIMFTLIGVFFWVTTHYGPTPEPEPEPTIEAPRVERPRIEPPRDSAISTLRAYLSAPSWRESLPLVLNREQIKPLMEAHYEGGSAWQRSNFEILTKAEPECEVGGMVAIDAVVGGKKVPYYLVKLDTGYLVDWESAVGANQMSPAEFRATTPARPVRFRALAQLSDYYNFSFSKLRDIFYSIRLTDAYGSEIGYGYTPRRAKAGHELFETLRDGRQRRVVVDLEYLPDPWPPESAQVFAIRNVPNVNGWFLEEDERVSDLSPLSELSPKFWFK